MVPRSIGRGLAFVRGGQEGFVEEEVPVPCLDWTGGRKERVSGRDRRGSDRCLRTVRGAVWQDSSCVSVWRNKILLTSLGPERLLFFLKDFFLIQCIFKGKIFSEIRAWKKKKNQPTLESVSTVQICLYVITSWFSAPTRC